MKFEQNQSKSSKSINKWPQQAQQQTQNPSHKATVTSSSGSSLVSRSPSRSSSLWTSSTATTSTTGWSSSSAATTAATATSSHQSTPTIASLPPKPPQKCYYLLNDNTSSKSNQSNLQVANKFHRAAIDGYVDMLCEASKRDTNLAAQDQFGLTPTLLAAQSGQLDALRILVGRGGDPERVSAMGSTALHLAAARNHLNCVSFLVNFGVNMWSLDNELHTAKDVAAIEQQNEVLDYLDQMMAKQSAINTKSVQKLKEKAKNRAEKRLKCMRKAQMKAIKQVERDERLLAKMSNNRRLLKAAHSLSDIKLVGRVSVDPMTAASQQLGAPVNVDDNHLQQHQHHLQTGGQNNHQQQQASLTSFINSRLQADLWSRRRKVPAPSTVPASTNKTTHLKELKFNNNQLFNPDLDSPCAPSTSTTSTSGYLSSTSAKSILKSVMSSASGGKSQAASCCSPASSRRRPRYSDLVAVQVSEAKRPSKPWTTSSTSTEGEQQQQQQSPAWMAANSSVANRLRAISGVSRKVHLKRLLFSNEPKVDQTRQQATTSQSAHLKRAKSEPDFCSALRDASTNLQSASDLEDSEEEKDDDQDDIELDVDEEESPSNGSNTVEEQPTGVHESPPVPPPPPPPVLPLLERHRQHHFDQKHLLIQCLSQLKLQHEAINKTSAGGGDHHQAPHLDCSMSCCELIKPSRMKQQQQQQFNVASQSDELIQLNLKLNAGDSPLRPSIIKQQQHQHQHLRASHSDHLDQASASTAKSTTILSVDSIGSAGSFVHRNVLHAATCNSSSGASSCSSGATSSSSSSSSRADEGPDEPGVDNSNHQPTANSSSSSSSMEKFLAQQGLAELADCLAREHIDLEALLLLTEDDLKSLNILLGPRRKLLNAIERHRAAGGQKAATDQQEVVLDTQF